MGQKDMVSLSQKSSGYIGKRIVIALRFFVEHVDVDMKNYFRINLFGQVESRMTYCIRMSRKIRFQLAEDRCLCGKPKRRYIVQQEPYPPLNQS